MGICEISLMVNDGKGPGSTPRTTEKAIPNVCVADGADRMRSYNVYATVADGLKNRVGEIARATLGAYTLA